MRVFNDDRLVSGAVWPGHPHRDVEGLTYVVEVIHAIGPERGAYVIDGAASFDDAAVETGDAAKLTEQPGLRIRAREATELILVDVPMVLEAVGIWRGRI